MSYRRPAHLALLALSGTALLVSCRPDAPSAPAVPAYGRSAAAPFAQRNAVKYRDSGIRPATGRSGSAAIAVEVLVGRTSTVLQVTSFRAGDLASPAGAIDKVQAKVMDAAGTVWRVINFTNLNAGPSVHVQLPSLPEGATVQVTAWVKGIDGRRSDVVTVRGVRAAVRPDLAALSLAVPAFAVEGVPTVLGLDLAELNGDHGARTDCVLYVAGTERDRARGIWVDAGDQVRCAFTVTIAVPGTYAVRGVAEDVEPADWDPTNNAATDSLVVLARADLGVDVLSYGLDAGAGTYVQGDTTTWRWIDPDGRVYLDRRYENEIRGQVEGITFTAAIGSTVASPVTRLEIALSSGGQLLRRSRHDGLTLSPGAGADCAADGLGTAEEVYVCTSTGFTTLALYRNAGTVIYLSRGYERTWNGTSYDEQTWVTNDTTSLAAEGQLAGNLDFLVQLTDGVRLFGFSGSATLAPTTIVEDEPSRCDTYPVVHDGVTYTATSCYRYLFRWDGALANTSGTGWSALVPAAP